jgi:autotransporter translocation and assembly factor TamB
MKRKRSSVWKVLGVLLLVPLLLVAFVQTPMGKQLLAAELSKRISRSENLTLKMGTIRGWIPFSVQIDRLEIGDADGVWLEAAKLHCRWEAKDLLDHRIRLSRLGAESITLRRRPTFGKTKRQPRAFQPLEVALENLNIEQFKMDSSVAGIPLEYSIHSGGLHLDSSGHFSGGLEVAGDAIGRVSMNAQLGGRVELVAELEELVNPSLGLDHLAGTISAIHSNSMLSAELALALRRDQLEGQLNAHLEFSNGQLRVVADFVDADARSFTLNTTTHLAWGQGGWSVEFQPLEIRALDWVGLLGSGRLGSDGIALEGTLEEFDLSALPIAGISNFTGRVGGTLSLAGTLEDPELRAELDVVHFSSSEDALDELPEINFHIAAQLAAGQLSASSVATNSALGFLEGGIEMPCTFAFSPFSFYPEPSLLHARFLANMDFGIFNRLALLDNQRIAGQLQAELVYDQHLRGFVRVKQGAYEHFDWGVVLRDLNLDLEASGAGLQIKTATASDGGEGRVSLDGSVCSRQVALDLHLNKAAILRRDDIEGMLSGNLEIRGPLKHPKVSGTLGVDRIEVLLDNLVPALPPLLTDFDPAAPSNTVAVVTKPNKTLPFGLDVRVDLADQVFVVASMIDSVWGGNLHLQDVPQGISVQGKIEPRRGHLSFIGKKFRFTGGAVNLDGVVPASPVMEQVTAEYKRGDFIARLILSGRFDNPVFRLESTPALPEDEVLSQVLFGRDTSSISPYQAIQIASAARQLSGGMNGPGLMYQMRQAVGIDTLEFREGETDDDAASLAAGKYITPSLYVEVSRSLDEKGDMGMMAEYELSEHFSVETSTGPKMRPGIGVTWRNDY